MSRFLFVLTLALVAIFAQQAFAMTSVNYSLPWDSINSGGDETATSTNYTLYDTVGDQATGVSTSTNYRLSAGYRTGDADYSSISFNIYNQLTSAISSSYSTFDVASKYVVVSAPGSFSVGDVIAAVEHLGLSEKAAVGKIVSISGNRLYVDRWDGDTGTMNFSPTGSNLVFVLSDVPTLDFGSMTGPVTKQLLSVPRVSTTANHGYSVYMTADGALRSTVHSIAGVTDGIVSAAQEEYGWHLTGSLAATSTALDYPFTTQTVPIQQDTVSSTGESVCLTYKLSVLSTTVSGAHSQQVTYAATANF